MASVPFTKLANEEVQRKREDLRRISLQLWNRPELAYQEREAHSLLCKLLEDEGFNVSRHYLLETGFRAEFACPSKKEAATTAAVKAIPPRSRSSSTGSDGRPSQCKDGTPSGVGRVGGVPSNETRNSSRADSDSRQRRPLPLKPPTKPSDELHKSMDELRIRDTKPAVPFEQLTKSVIRTRGLGIIKSSDVQEVNTSKCSAVRAGIFKKGSMFEESSTLKDASARLRRLPPERGNRQPKVAFLCEYDALPEIGHACGHNLIAESALAMALVAKRVISEAPAGTFEGAIVVLGTPAEEGGGGKIKMLEAFDDIDAAFIVHPCGLGVSVLNGTTLCSSRLQANFRSESAELVVGCEDTQHMSADLNLRSMNSTNAMDAAAIAYGHLAMLRKTLPEGWRLCVALRSIVASREVQLEISYRSEKGRDMEPLRDRIVHTLKCAADSMRCQMDFKFTVDYLDQWPNRVLSSRIARYCSVFDRVASSPKDYEIRASSDVGNVSQILPTIQVFASINDHASPHQKKFAEAARTEAAESVILEVATACAMAALDFLADPQMRRDAWDELLARQKAEQRN